MATITVTPNDGVTVGNALDTIDGSVQYRITFPKNTTLSHHGSSGEITYTITYDSGNGCTGETTYTVPEGFCGPDTPVLTGHTSGGTNTNYIIASVVFSTSTENLHGCQLIATVNVNDSNLSFTNLSNIVADSKFCKITDIIYVFTTGHPYSPQNVSLSQFSFSCNLDLCRSTAYNGSWTECSSITKASFDIDGTVFEKTDTLSSGEKIKYILNNSGSGGILV